LVVSEEVMATFGQIETEYAPILAVRPAEMAALEELPKKDKDKLLPVILLRPWVTSRTLDKALERIENAYGDRKWIADFDYDHIRNAEAAKRDVHAELDALKSPKNGYENWCKFIYEHSNTIPTIQIRDPNEIASQVKRLEKLGRGIVVRLQLDAFPQAKAVAELVTANTNEPILFMLDHGQMNEELLPSLKTIATARAILGVKNDILIAPSGTSFPFEFRDRTRLEILERRYFNQVRKSLNGADLLYSDRGSARAEVMAGGAVPVPRIDYPLSDEWRFYRDEDGYQSAAQALLKTKGKIWIDGLQIWGTQMIERTARGDAFAIESPVKATACRINIHLHQQLYYGKPIQDLLDTDDDWAD